MSTSPIRGWLRPAGFWQTSIDGSQLLSEPHHLLLDFGTEQARLTDCRCEECSKLGEDFFEIPAIGPESLADFLIEEQFDRLEIVIHPDLALPDSEGKAAQLFTGIHGFAQAVADAGLDVRLIEFTPPETGTWVRAVAYAFFDPEHVVVPGLLGRIADDPHNLATPGISLFVQSLSASERFALPEELFELLEEVPTAEEQKAATKLEQRALEAFEREHGWTGYLRLGKGRLRHESEVRNELSQLVARMAGSKASPLSDAERRGTWKRIRKILGVLEDRAGSADASALLARVGLPAPPVGGALELMLDLQAFAEKPLLEQQP